MLELVGIFFGIFVIAVFIALSICVVAFAKKVIKNYIIGDEEV